MTPSESIQKAIDSLIEAWEVLKASRNLADRYIANRIGIEIARLQQLVDFI